MAVVRSPDFLRALIRETALATLIHQRRLTPSCGGHAPTAERTVGPARMIAESLTPKPGIREQNLPKAQSRFLVFQDKGEAVDDVTPSQDRWDRFRILPLRAFVTFSFFPQTECSQ